MKIKVIYEYRALLLPHNNMGTMLENGVTILDFEIPKELADYTNRSLVVTNSVGSHVLPLTNNQVELTKKETGESSAEIQLVLKDSNDNEWCSQPYIIDFYRRIDDSGKNIVTDAVIAQKEKDRKQLADAATRFFGADYSDSSFDDMTKQIGSAVALNAGEITVDDVSLNDRTILPPEGKNAISKVTVKALKKNTLKVTSNGIYPPDISSEPPDGAVAPPKYWTKVEVNVPEPELTSFAVKPSRETKTYTAADSDKTSPSGRPFNGIEALTVEAVDATIDENIKPENIRQGIDILGVQGNLIALDEDKQKRLDEYDLLSSVVEQMNTMPNILTLSYTDAEGNNKLVKVPYLPTKNMTKYSGISNSVEECGLDLSKCPSAGNGVSSRLLQNGRQNLKKIKLTGIQSVYSMAYFFGQCVLEEIELYQDGAFSPSEQWKKTFYVEMFYHCPKLKSIIGDPLDLSVATDYTRIFTSDILLQYVRFKPGTIKNDISFSSSAYLYRGKYGEDVNDPGTLLSILNGVRPYASGDNTITVAFNAETKTYLDLWRCKIDPDTGLYVVSEDSNDKTLRTAFTADKGVVIA